MVGAMKVQNAPKYSTASQQQLQQPQQAQQPPPAPKVVGPNVRGNREEYQLVRRLQSALFGGVYEAKGLSSGRDFAIKVLHKSELSKAEETSSIEFCEVPLSEIRFAEVMRGDENVMEPEEHFEDAYCFYVVFDLCRGGDLLEALKEKPHGFDEAHAQFLMKQAAKGLAFLHKRKVAMQDVSLENLLLNVAKDSGEYQVKICDPGQAVIFEHDQAGEEMQVGFRGLVGKSFRPPELHEQRPYLATKVDSWCLGWSTFYLLTAQPLFMSADPAQQDADWLLFQQGDYSTLFQQKSNLCSNTGLDFIFRLMQLQPSRRMSITDALEHAWLKDPRICPVLAPPDLLPESMRTNGDKKDAEAGQNKAHESVAMQALAAVSGSSTSLVADSSDLSSVVAPTPQAFSAATPITSSAITEGNPNHMPTWAAASITAYGKARSPTVRVRSPMRAPRATQVHAASPRTSTSGHGPSAATASQHAANDARRGRPHNPQPGASARSPYLIATAHSPPPTAHAHSNQQASHQTQQRLPKTSRVSSSHSPDMGGSVVGVHRPTSPQGHADASQPRPAFTTPRASSRHKVEAPECEAGSRDRAWTFRASGEESQKVLHAQGRGRASSPVTTTIPSRVTGSPFVTAAQRQVQSPGRNQPIYIHRSSSPVQAVQSVDQNNPACKVTARPAMRTHSPGSPARTTASGFSWAHAPTIYSPRAGVQVHMGPRGTSPVRAVAPISFAWSPEPVSPHTSPRNLSPTPSGTMTITKGVTMTSARTSRVA